MTHSPSPSAPAIEIKGLTKTYAASKKAPAKSALKGVDLTIPRGSIFGLLGPNGAGKSTMINILAGLVNKSSGSAKICGYDIKTQTRQARASIGIVPCILYALSSAGTPSRILRRAKSQTPERGNFGRAGSRG